MGQVALPELRRYGYSGSLATGALAAGGTLGIMIPPSVPLVIYAILTQESIGKLFMAAVLPGIIAMLGYMLVVRIVVTLNPAAGPAGPDVPWQRETEAASSTVLPVLLVFVVVIVGIYGGWANPTEAAAIGAAACGILAVVTGGMRAQGPGRQRARHRAGDGDDLPGAAGRRHAEHDARAVADAGRARELGQGQRAVRRCW